MGRPLKIKESTTVDIGFNPFSALTNSTIPTGMTTAQYLGVVGGGANGGIATAANPTVAATAFFPVAGELPAYIITQKGATKYLVAGNNSIAGGSFVAGNTYIIKTLGTTNFNAIGAGVNPQIGDVFTATGVGSGTGTASSVAVCVLVNVAASSLAAGEMQITVTTNTVAFQASRLTNKYVWDYSTPAVKYAADFFIGSAASVTTAGSGAEIDTWTNATGNYELGQVSDYTS